MKPDKKTYLDKIINFLGGLKLSFILLVLLGGLAAQRAIISQKKAITMEDTPWFLRILNLIGLNSPDSLVMPLLVVLFFFVLNLGFSSFRMARRVLAKQKNIGGFKTADAIGNLPNNVMFQSAVNSERVITYFKKKGFRVAYENADAETCIYAGKREAGLWGVFFFHLTFFTVLIGVLLSLLTRYAGYVELSPGETFVEKRENYLRVSDKPVLFGHDRMFGLQLEQINLSYWAPGVVKQRASIVNIYDDKGSFIGKKRIEVNRPLNIYVTNIYQGSQHGYIAGLEAEDSEGNKAIGRVRFRIPEKQDDRMIAMIILPGTRLNLELELFTEKLGEIEGLEIFRSQYMATLIKVTSIERGRRVFRGVIFGGSRLSFEGLTIRFVSLTPYSSFVIIRDYGVPVIFASFVFLLSGLLIAYFWVPERYWAVIKKQDGAYSVIIGATAERYKESFKEHFAERIAELQSGDLKT